MAAFEALFHICDLNFNVNFDENTEAQCKLQFCRAEILGSKENKKKHPRSVFLNFHYTKIASAELRSRARGLWNVCLRKFPVKIMSF